MLSAAKKDFYFCLFLGIFGVHKFRSGKPELGFFYFLTLGIFGIGWIVDTIIYFTKMMRIKKSTFFTYYDELSEMNQIKTGYEFEEYIAGLLELLGYDNIKSTNPSRDFGADIIAERDNQRYAFQCKLYAGPVGLSAVQEVYAAVAYYNCHVGVAVTNNFFTMPAYDLADATDVVLWDREKISTLLDEVSNI